MSAEDKALIKELRLFHHDAAARRLRELSELASEPAQLLRLRWLDPEHEASFRARWGR